MSAARGSGIKRLLAIILIFILVGPPVGAVVFLLAVGLVGMGHGTDLSGLSWVALFAVIYGIPMGYLIGIWPAAVAGVVVGVRQAFFGRMRWWLAAASGIVVGLGFMVATGQPILGDEINSIREQGPIMIGTCLAATIVCWAIVRNWHAAAPDAGVSS